MRVSPTRVAEVARLIVEHETAGVESPAEIATAIERAFVRLYQMMSSLVGQVGFAAVVDRAIHASERECSWLEQTEIMSEPAVAISGLSAVVEREGVPVVLRCIAQLLATILTTVSTFIGTDLTIRLVRRVWTDLPGTPTGTKEPPA